MNTLIPTSVKRLKEITEEVVQKYVEPNAESVDRNCEWPEQSLRALGNAGLNELLVPRRLGGHEQGLLALAVVAETIARSCPSTSMCYGMHCLGTTDF